jgi:hypothetical protein
LTAHFYFGKLCIAHFGTQNKKQMTSVNVKKGNQEYVVPAGSTQVSQNVVFNPISNTKCLRKNIAVAIMMHTPNM